MVPIYIRYLGKDAYGLIAFYSIMLWSVGFLEQAVTPAVTREIAQNLSGGDAQIIRMRNALRTGEFVVAVVAVLIGIGGATLAPLIARHWLIIPSMSHGYVTVCIDLMCLTLALQWPSYLYTGAFIAIQRQAIWALIRIVVLTIQAAGAFIIVVNYVRNPMPVFIWQALTFGSLSVVLGNAAWRLLPSSDKRPQFDLDIVKSLWKFALGTFLIGFTAMLLNQIDKLVLSGRVPISSFGAYSLCFTIASLLFNMIVWPIGLSVLPRLIALHASGQQDLIELEYRKYTQLSAALCVPAAISVSVYSHTLVSIWLGHSPEFVEQMTRILPYIMTGTLFSALCGMPYILRLAHGKTRLTVARNCIGATVILIPLLIVPPNSGILWGAIMTLLVGAGQYLFEAPVTHRKLIRTSIWSWYFKDTLPAIFGATGSGSR